MNKKSKSIFLTAIAAISLICTFGCKKDADIDGFNSYNLHDVTGLVVVNGSSLKKKPGDNWLSIDIKNREALVEDAAEQEQEPSVSSEYGYIEHTVPFIPTELPVAGGVEAREAVDSREERAAKTVKPTKYVLGEPHTFSDSDPQFIGKARNGVMTYEGEHCYIWTFKDEPNDSKMSDDEIKAFAEAFDKIYLKETALCGETFKGDVASGLYNVITPDEKVSLVLYDIGSDLGRGVFYGYFSPSMYYTNQSGENAMEAIFVDSYFAKQEKIFPALISTVAHEFNHLLNYVQKSLKYGFACESWYTEMLSMITEDFLMEDLKIDLSNSPQSRLIAFVNKGYNCGFKNWHFNDSLTQYSYGNAYAFGAFLARNYGGATLIQEIATNEFVNEESVVDAVNKINGTNLSFDDLIKLFTAILYNIDNDNSALPSLNKDWSGKITGKDGLEYDFSLTKIHPSCFEEIVKEPIVIKFNDVNKLSDAELDSYGFLAFKFDGKTDLKLRLKDFLFYTYY